MVRQEDDYALHGGLLGNGPLPAVAAGEDHETEGGKEADHAAGKQGGSCPWQVFHDQEKIWF